MYPACGHVNRCQSQHRIQATISIRVGRRSVLLSIVATACHRRSGRGLVGDRNGWIPSVATLHAFAPWTVPSGVPAISRRTACAFSAGESGKEAIIARAAAKLSHWAACRRWLGSNAAHFAAPCSGIPACSDISADCSSPVAPTRRVGGFPRVAGPASCRRRRQYPDCPPGRK